MEPRLNYTKLSNPPYQSMLSIGSYLRECGLEIGLLHLVWLRASQMNGCAFCCDMHAREALRDGEDQRRLHVLAAWREAAFFTERERAALAWTEAVTRIAQTRAPDEAFAALRDHFSDKEIADLTFAIANINAWNRLAISFRAVVK
ncbi:carboxymuconolactone decarboxylase family protein [Pandoraea sp.]|uniref:carboxymuconolactone decarboxylase family protein n=1 Tax=Pandoraea sp. TaxID=1883445 RepID=UPI001201E7C8|nr:carboxymuconolactone decarboxylase family protein [Pandoraea sp.]TAL55759.1 MAG: carboxymuconolactone decarboxylase family protein [Pandoraea sp.]TAM19363.1 MAG: carboxymuconolactone decarboxylase family protein [Pandoraea sp.]